MVFLSDSHTDVNCWWHLLLHDIRWRRCNGRKVSIEIINATKQLYLHVLNTKILHLTQCTLRQNLTELLAARCLHLVSERYTTNKMADIFDMSFHLQPLLGVLYNPNSNALPRLFQLIISTITNFLNMVKCGLSLGKLIYRYVYMLFNVSQLSSYVSSLLSWGGKAEFLLSIFFVINFSPISKHKTFMYHLNTELTS